MDGFGAFRKLHKERLRRTGSSIRPTAKRGGRGDPRPRLHPADFLCATLIIARPGCAVQDQFFFFRAGPGKKSAIGCYGSFGSGSGWPSGCSGAGGCGGFGCFQPLHLPVCGGAGRWAASFFRRWRINGMRTARTAAKTISQGSITTTTSRIPCTAATNQSQPSPKAARRRVEKPAPSETAFSL